MLTSVVQTLTASIIPHEEFLRKVDEAFDRSKEDFATSFRLKYTTAMPIWMCIELWDFGTLSNVLSGMRSDDLRKLADRYGLPRNKLLISWAQSINFVRNVCAHHGRLWNRPPVQQPGPTRIGEIELLDHLATDEYAQRRLYAVASSLQYLLRTIHPDTSWSPRLIAHLDGFPKTQGLSIRQMGFAENWTNLDLWRLCAARITQPQKTQRRWGTQLFAVASTETHPPKNRGRRSTFKVIQK